MAQHGRDALRGQPRRKRHRVLRSQGTPSDDCPLTAQAVSTSAPAVSFGDPTTPGLHPTAAAMPRDNALYHRLARKAIMRPLGAWPSRLAPGHSCCLDVKPLQTSGHDLPLPDRTSTRNKR